MNLRMKSLRVFSLAMGLISFSISNAGVLEEVVVTAQKKDQPLQDVGIAVTAFTGNQLKQLGWSNAEKVTSMTPGVTTIQPNGPSAFFTNIRGVAQNDFSGDHQESPVAIYVDEAYVSAASGAGFQMFDYERVEILRGPQGTLFGRNATGGLVHYITKKPDRAADGYLEFTAGDYDQTKLEGAAGGGLTENISGRVSFVRNKHDGVLKNSFGPDLNDGDDWAVRGKLLIEFDSGAEWLIGARAGEQDVNIGPFTHQSARLNPLTGLGESFNGTDLSATGDSRISAGYQDPDDDLFKASINVEGFNRIETSGITSNFSIGIGDSMKFVSITDITTLEKNYIEDSDAGPNDFFAFSLRSDIDQFSQEFRLSGERDSMSWVAGVFYLGIDGDFLMGAPHQTFLQQPSRGLALMIHLLRH